MPLFHKRNYLFKIICISVTFPIHQTRSSPRSEPDSSPSSNHPPPSNNHQILCNRNDWTTLKALIPPTNNTIYKWYDTTHHQQIYHNLISSTFDNNKIFRESKNAQFKQVSFNEMRVKCTGNSVSNSVLNISLYHDVGMGLQNVKLASFQIIILKPPDSVKLTLLKPEYEVLKLQQSNLPFAKCETYSRPPVEFIWTIELKNSESVMYLSQDFDVSTVSLNSKKKEKKLDDSLNFNADFDSAIPNFVSNSSSIVLVPLYDYKYDAAKITCKPKFNQKYLNKLSQSVELKLSYKPQNQKIIQENNKFTCSADSNENLNFIWTTKENPNTTVSSDEILFECGETANQRENCELICEVRNSVGSSMKSITVKRQNLDSINSGAFLTEVSLKDFRNWFSGQNEKIRVLVVLVFSSLLVSLATVLSYACYLTFCVGNRNDRRVNQNRQLQNNNFSNQQNHENLQNQHNSSNLLQDRRKLPVSASFQYPNSASSLMSDATLERMLDQNLTTQKINLSDRDPILLRKKATIIRSRTLSGYPCQNTAPFDQSQRFSYTAIPEEDSVVSVPHVMRETQMSPQTREEWGQLHRLLGTPSTLPRQVQKVSEISKGEQMILKVNLKK